MGHAVAALAGPKAERDLVVTAATKLPLKDLLHRDWILSTLWYKNFRVTVIAG